MTTAAQMDSVKRLALKTGKAAAEVELVWAKVTAPTAKPVASSQGHPRHWITRDISNSPASNSTTANVQSGAPLAESCVRQSKAGRISITAHTTVLIPKATVPERLDATSSTTGNIKKAPTLIFRRSTRPTR